MKKAKYFIGPIVVAILIFAYYSPWLLTNYGGGDYKESIGILRIHTISVLFFSMASFPTIGLIIFTIVSKIRKNSNWVILTNVSLSLLVLNFAISIGMSKGYFIGGHIM